MKPKKIPSTARGRKRLLKLADLLEADAKNKSGLRFDMGTWGHSDKTPTVSCGTTACAMGLAALSGVFKRAGLTYKIRDIYDWIGSEKKEIKMIEVRCQDEDSEYAAAKLFDITIDESSYLFTEQSGIGARGERKMANLIRRFVAGKNVGVYYDE